MPNKRGSANSGGILRIRDEEYHAFRQLIYDEVGIHLNDSKRELVSSRLAKRLRHHGFTTYSQYYDYLMKQDHARSERHEMVNCITTNKTEFFREADHFTYLKNKLFPQLRDRTRTGPRRLHIWCAASSTGEEPYSIAMTLLEHFGPPAGWDVKIVASDVDTEVLAKAERGIYSEEAAEAIPEALRRKYCLRGRGSHAGQIQIRPEVRDLISFQRINLIEEPWPFRGVFDIIFCRNVIIYFDRPTQQRLFQRMARCLDENGYLFLGHSENLHWMTDLFTPLGGTIYRPSRGKGSGASSPSRHGKAGEAEGSEALALPEKNILVGELYASKEPVVIQTLLGSCLAACLFDPEARVGGMNHFLLPDGDSSPENGLRYGAAAMDHLVAKLVALGAHPGRLRAKLFGGCYLRTMGSGMPDVGSRNIAFAEEFLAERNIPVLARCVGLKSALKVRFFPHEGKVLVKPLEPAASRRLAEAEARLEANG